MKTKFDDFILEVLDDNKIITLYHGSKSGVEFDDFNFKTFPYFYLTPEPYYALSYAKIPENVLKFKVDTTNFIDLSSLTNFSEYKSFVKLFYQKTGAYYPPEHSSYPQQLINSNRHFDLWELIRFDSNGYISKRLLNKGINGFKMTEWYVTKDNQHIVYVLLNNDPIVREIT